MNCNDLNDIEGLKFMPMSGDYSRQDFSCIYKIVSIISNKHYIGSAKHFGIRRRNHVFQLLNKKHHSIILQNHVNKYGIEDLYFVILEFVKWNDKVYEKEQYYIDNTKPNFNVLLTANTSFGRKATPETIKKLILSHTGKSQSEETKTKKSIACKLSMMLLTDEQKNNRKNGAISQRKKVICNETNIIYDSLAQAERDTGCDNIWLICQGQRKHSFGFTFKYYLD